VTVVPAIEHMLLRLRPLSRALRVAVDRQGQAAARLFRADVTPLCVTDEQVQTLLHDVDELLNGPISQDSSSAFTLNREEAAAEEELRRRSRVSGIALPLDHLSKTLSLSSFEQEAVLLCAAVELDRTFERIYAYILDDLNRRNPCVELLCNLTVDSLAERCRRRQALGRYGKLRRMGVLQAYGDRNTEGRQELCLRQGLFSYLTGGPADVTSLRDPAEVTLPDVDIPLPVEVDPALIRNCGAALRDHHVEVLGVWGPRHSGQSEIAIAIAAAAGLPLRRWLYQGASSGKVNYEQSIAESIHSAAAVGAILWVDTDPLTEPGSEGLRSLSTTLAEALAASQVPIILTGVNAWRPTVLLGMRPYAQMLLSAPDYATRQLMWQNALPDVTESQRDDLAARFRMQPKELKAVAKVAHTQAWLSRADQGLTFDDQVEEACAAVARKHSYHFATVITPRRGADDLILSPSLHNQVLEIARFHKSWPRVAEAWGFGRLVTGEGGIKALFTGDSGTGKTLAAEVIAGELRMPLLKIDLSRIVSKWVGETEKHLEEAFSEAEDSNAVLFFDEADSLFGKRGEVRHGVDRYANLEVSYLLQRLETYYGLVILASNMRENIDPAFTRRFQVMLHFPRPGPAERRRMWRLAFPSSAPLEDDTDFDLLARLDMTGASIVSAAQTAALLSLEKGGEDHTNGHRRQPSITKELIVRAISRQYVREARLLTASELGSYASFLDQPKKA